MQACKNKCVFEKQVLLFLVSTGTVKRICNLISAGKATFLPTIQVHPELDGRKLDIVHSFNTTDSVR